MHKYVSLLLIYATVILISCQKQPVQSVEKGVSFELNKHRRESLDSVRYAITLDIPGQKKERIRGTINISFLLKSVDSPLVLDFNSDPASVLHVQAGGKQVAYTFENEHIVIDRKNLKKGRNEISITFVAGDLSLNRSDDYLYTLFVPDRASTCFPLFDQPNLKAVYQLTLKTPDAWEAVSNGVLQEKKDEGGRSIYTFGQTKPISSYLFAFAAGKFFKTKQTVGRREMTMYYRETDTAKVSRNRQEVFQLHARSLDWLEAYTAIDYPFGKFDFVLLPSFQYGGMEHPGSIFYNESALFLDENASVNRKMARASVIAHESAHMWFGDLVTMDWFNDVWLKEVFANFMAAKIVHPAFPEINHELRFLLAHYPGAYEVDRTAGTNPILQKLDNLKNAGTLYGAIIYLKAPIVMRQLERKIGEDAMRDKLREYLKTFQFGNATWDDLVHIMDGKSSHEIREWSNVWVKTAGMPVYELRNKGGNFAAVQAADTVASRTWEQPVLVKTLPGGIIYPNADGLAYGFFKMDPASMDQFAGHYHEAGDSLASDPVFRGSMLVNIWENTLHDYGSDPQKLFGNVLMMLPKEENPLLIDYLLGNLQTTWWNFLDEHSRQRQQVVVEALLWKLLVQVKDKGIKSSYFRSFRNVVRSEQGLGKLESLWSGKLVVKDLVLSEDDKIALACELALKAPAKSSKILKKQLAETQNPDRRQKLQFVIPALSPDEKVRDAFFESLKIEENREKEAWVLEALAYLHHPLRARSAEKYLRPSLDLLQEIQLTGDIFFPTRWTNVTFSGHSSPEAARIAADFLKEHPDYPYFLKNKVLQATDQLNRATMLKAHKAR